LAVAASDQEKKRGEATDLKEFGQVRLLVSIKLQYTNVTFSVIAARGHFTRHLQQEVLY